MKKAKGDSIERRLRQTKSRRIDTHLPRPQRCRDLLHLLVGVERVAVALPTFRVVIEQPFWESSTSMRSSRSWPGRRETTP